ncbi:MAG: zinc-ribbon domain-containing protein [Candidatus Pacebacteria bacterium]|nr:zinc-ribbon domain-containing protein [Candidatus Paceibacterota bacterium]
MFCKNCGKEIEEDARFCKSCGIATGQEKKEQDNPNQATSAKPKPLAIEIIAAILQLLIGGLLLFWIWYSYGCIVGKYPDTGDYACRQMYLFFKQKQVDPVYPIIPDKSKCIPTGCGSLWYSSCTKRCYQTESDCRQTKEACSGNVMCRQCP